jgi:hypothetical protein
MKKQEQNARPQDVAAKIVEMIFDSKAYKNGDSVEMYNNV